MKVDAVQRQEVILCEAREQLFHLRHGHLPAFSGRCHPNERFEVVLHIAEHFPVTFGPWLEQPPVAACFVLDLTEYLNPLPYTLLIDSRSAPGVDAIIKGIECEKSALLWNT
jgi:hypothetical protein